MGVHGCAMSCSAYGKSVQGFLIGGKISVELLFVRGIKLIVFSLFINLDITKPILGDPWEPSGGGKNKRIITLSDG